MPKHILLVEDHSVTVELMQAQLQMLGYAVSVARNGIEGVAMASAIAPDLIILDMRMPKLSGFEAAKELRQNPATKHIPILAATALTKAADYEKCLASGCDDYLAKPFDHHELAQAIGKLMETNPRSFAGR